MPILSRALRVALLVPLLAGCDDDGSSPDRLEPADVAGTYAVCQLLFVPEGGTLASVNVTDRAFETQNTGVQPPVLRIDAAEEVELAFTPRGGFVSQSIRGQYDTGDASVTLRLDDRGTAARGALLLPERLTLDFQPSPRALTSGSATAYGVPRADYARLSGQSETNLAPEIRGTLTGVFRAGGCG